MRDIDVRLALRERKLQKFFLDGQSRVVEEFGIFQGESRIDVAVINGSLYGYEIKSENDTLYRLQSQLSQYSLVFDYLTFVIGSKHIESASNMLPEWCGIMEAYVRNGQLQLKELRKSRKNQNVNSIALAQLLWKDEIIALINQKGVTRGIVSKPKKELWRLLSELYPLKELSKEVRQALKLRANWRVVQ